MERGGCFSLEKTEGLIETATDRLGWEDAYLFVLPCLGDEGVNETWNIDPAYLVLYKVLLA